MRVKIIKVSKTTLWYFDKVIGKYFYVDDNIIIDSQGYEGLTLTYNKGRYIYLEDTNYGRKLKLLKIEKKK